MEVDSAPEGAIEFKKLGSERGFSIAKINSGRAASDIAAAQEVSIQEEAVVGEPVHWMVAGRIRYSIRSECLG